MAEAEIICEVCGTSNPPTATDCKECGMKLKGLKEGGEVEKLLKELVQSPETDQAKASDDGLGLDKETVDELLDSLLVETSAAEAEEAAKGAEAGVEVPQEEEVFECPQCGAEVAADAASCPNCGAKFAAPVEAPAAEAAAEEAPPPPEEEAPAVAVSETETSKVSALSGRLIDFTVIGTVVVLVLLFAVFQMWSQSNVSALVLVVFAAVAAAGFGTGLVFFRLSTSATTQADRLVKEGRYEDAIALYDRAIRMGSKPATAWTSKGVAFKRLGRLDEAMRCHNVALKLNPKNEIAWCNKGDILFRAGKLDKAIECFDKAIELRPKYAIAWNNKGAALAKEGRYEDARECEDRAVELRPKYIAAWLNRGEVLARLGQRDEAARCLERARALGA